MSSQGSLPRAPEGSSLESVVSAVGLVYAKIEADQASFLASAAARGSPLRCPPGCGDCCEHFAPDVLPAEAAFAAAWILERAPELAAAISSWQDGGHAEAPPCPFLRSSAEGKRCAIYPARPLICRLFCASGVRDREGRVSFRPCSRMPLAGYPALGEERPSLAGDGLVEAFGAEPPVMSDYATRIVGLSPSESGERCSLLEAFPAALIRVGMTLSLAERERDSTYSGHDGRTD